MRRPSKQPEKIRVGWVTPELAPKVSCNSGNMWTSPSGPAPSPVYRRRDGNALPRLHQRAATVHNGHVKVARDQRGALHTAELAPSAEAQRRRGGRSWASEAPDGVVAATMPAGEMFRPPGIKAAGHGAWPFRGH